MSAVRRPVGNFVCVSSNRRTVRVLSCNNMVSDAEDDVPKKTSTSSKSRPTYDGTTASYEVWSELAESYFIVKKWHNPIVENKMHTQQKKNTIKKDKLRLSIEHIARKEESTAAAQTRWWISHVVDGNPTEPYHTY